MSTENRITLRCSHSPPQIRIRHTLGRQLVDSWWGRRSVKFWMGPSAYSRNSVLGHMRDDRCAMFSINFAHSVGSNCPSYTAGQTGHAIYTATFAISGVLREDVAGILFTVYKRDLAMSLLQLQSCGNHYTWKGEAMLSLFLTGQGGRYNWFLSAANSLLWIALEYF